MTKMDELATLRSQESGLLAKFLEVRKNRIRLESELFGQSLFPFAVEGVSESLIRTPFQMAKVLAVWIKGEVGEVLEYSRTKDLLSKWATLEAHSPSLTLVFEGKPSDFADSTVLALKDELEKVGVEWKTSGDGGFSVLHNKTRVLRLLSPVILAVIRKRKTK